MARAATPSTPSARGARENVWNGRPISLIVPAEPLTVLGDKVVPLIELIPPVHQRVYRMGLEHLGLVVGDAFDSFTHVKSYRLSLRESVELGAGPFDEGFHHVDDWVPHRLVTATGPNPSPRLSKEVERIRSDDRASLLVEAGEAWVDPASQLSAASATRPTGSGARR